MSLYNGVISIVISVGKKAGKHHSLLNVSQLRTKIMCWTLVCITWLWQIDHSILVLLKLILQPAYILRDWEEGAVELVLGTQDKLSRYEKLVWKNLQE